MQTKECDRCKKCDSVYRPHTWHELSDDEINMWVNKRLCVPKNAMVLCPSVSHMIKEEKDFSFVTQVCNDVKMKYTENIIAIINNRSSETQPGQYHWSCVVYNHKLNTGYHVDSLAGLNSGHAERFCRKLSRYFRGD